ncbi:MAG: hypothetical protein AAFX01_10745 [Cyanobacteria bacterium J06638_28]
MNVDFNPEALECPRCGKHVLVRRGNDHYRCLWCGFRRDISESGDISGFWGVFLAIIITVLIFA